MGKGGRVFQVLKFRSMVPDAEASSGPCQASERDPRTTRVGRWLRATAMDELPQLLSIVRGDMSFVGPRALRPGEIEVEGGGAAEALEDVPGFERRCSVPPGLTGVAQVFAPRDIPRRQKFRYDLLYIRKQSFGARPPFDNPVVLDYLPRDLGSQGTEILTEMSCATLSS